MTTSVWLEEFKEASDPPTLDATLLLSVPHWWDDETACELLAGVGGQNGGARGLVSRVKSLPFVQPYEGRGWRVAPAQRAELVRELRPARRREANRALADMFGSAHDRCDDSGSLAGRDLQWRAAFHAAPVRPAEATRRLLAFVAIAAEEHRTGDLAAAASVFRHHAMEPFRRERLYIEGRYAYAQHRNDDAFHSFLRVWGTRVRDQLMSISGHLIGVYLADPKKQRLPQAERVLRRAMSIARDIRDDAGESLIIVSLVNVILARNEQEKYDEAVVLLDRAEQLRGGSDHHIDGTKAQVLIAAGDYERARKLLEDALTRARADREFTAEGVALLTSSWLARREHRIADAVRFMDEKLELDLQQRDGRLASKSAGRLAELLAEAKPDDVSVGVLIAEPGMLIYHRNRVVVLGFVDANVAESEHAIAVPEGIEGVWQSVHSGSEVVLADGVRLADVRDEEGFIYLTRR